MKFAPEVVKEIKYMTVGCGVCAAIVLAGFIIFSGFSLPLLFGVAAGYLLAIGNFYFMAVGMTIAMDTGEEFAAKKKLRVSYILRTVVVLGVLVGAILLSQNTGIINWIPVAAGVFYVRIVIAAKSVINYYKLKKNPEIYSAVPDDENDDENADSETEDGFEKFVGHFAKGPLPGADLNDKNKTEKDTK